MLYTQALLLTRIARALAVTSSRAGIYFSFFSALYRNSRHTRRNSAYDFIINGTAHIRKLLDGQFLAEKNNLVPLLYARYIRNVNRQLIHTDSADYICPFAVYKHIALV